MANEPQPETGITSAPQPAPEAAPETAITLPRGAGAVTTDAAQSVPLTAPDDEDNPRWLTKADWLLLGLLVLLSFIVGLSPALNSDVWLQLATGRLIAHGEYLPGGAEPFSVATEAREGHAAVPWINHSWLFALGLYAAYTTLGPVGVVVLKGLLVAAITVVLILVRNRDTNLLILAICLTLSVLAMATTRMFLQPVLVSYLMLALTLLVCHRAGLFDTAPTDDAEAPPRNERWLWALPVLCVLWVNLDSWFVLGPLMVGLCWAGLAIERWRGMALRVPLRRVGLVVGVSIAACFISPFHVRVFQLPPDLAYLFVRAGDAVGINLPDAVFGGGRTVAALHEIAREAQQADRRTLSPFGDGFLSNPNVGYNVCGVCFFPLLLAGLASFVLMGVVAGKRGAPPPHAGRFLVWLVFAMFATLHYRLIPFFAVVAGPIAALNFGELLAWYVTPAQAGEPPMPWVAPARLIRILGVPLLVALGLLAWPGWLNGPFDLDSSRHVVWDIPADPSLQKAAERLAELQTQEHGVRVFSTGMEMNAYCAWFAPGVKGFFDTRLSLFPDTVKEYFKAQSALADKSRPPSEWKDVLRSYRMDHVAAEKFMLRPQFMLWWQEPARWRQDFADRNVALFTWSGPTPHWPTDAVLTEWNALAFGTVPDAQRPPAHGPAVAPENRGFFDRYWEAPPRMPQAALDLDAKVAYGTFVVPRALEIAKRTQHVSTYALACLPLAPGACQGPYSVALAGGMVLVVSNTPPAQIRPELRDGCAYAFWTPLDFQPPAIPVLAMRHAWQAVAESPTNEKCYLVLANATARAQKQEHYWVNPRGEAPRTLRAGLRQVQLVSALQAAVEIGFSDPVRQYQVHMDLYGLYLDQYALDLALDQLKAAEAAVDTTPPADTRQEEERRAMKKFLEERRQALESEIDRRVKAFNLKTSTRSEREKIAELLYGTITIFTKDNQAKSDPRGWGLAGLALKLVQEIDPEKLSDKEKLPHVQLLIDRLYKVGRARQASELLDSVQDALGPAALPLVVYRAGTQGNYDELRDALAKLEAPRADIVTANKKAAFAFAAAMVLPVAPMTSAQASIGQLMSRESTWNGTVTGWQALANEYYSLMALRGICSLEAGDTAGARRIFEQALRESGGIGFVERPIAQRYAELLAAYQKP